jgi:hypothetical protein
MLWRVDVGDTSTRYVEADTADDACEQVAQALLACITVTATPAHTTLQEAFDAAGPIKRRNLLASLDSLIHPNHARRSRVAAAKLKRIIAAEENLKKWLSRDASQPSPPVDVDRLGRIIKSAEVEHLERNLARLQKWERTSPLHDMP